MKKTLIAMALSILCAAAPGCGDDGGGGGADADADTDADTDADSDTDQDAGPTEVLTWIPIPGGSFEMGCSDGDAECYDNESPAHAVEIAAFEMTETEVTQQEYFDVTGAGPADYYCPDCGVTKVSWTMAAEFCAAIGGRLPTEAEWEYAARAGTTTPYYCGSDPSCLDDVAWYFDNCTEGHAVEVKQKEPNAFGLYDMLGNANEWVQDCYHASYDGAPADGSAWEEAACEYYVMRGGGCGSTARATRASWRDGIVSNFYGAGMPTIRCARTPGDGPDGGTEE